MDKYAAITIDTESDHDRTWHKTKPIKFESVLFGIPERLQPLFNRYKATPTYLLAVEVIESPDCAGCLRSLSGRYELGTHLHPEYVEPDKKYIAYDSTLSKDFICYLKPEKEFLKIKTITDMFIKNFGYPPVSFRAGRFGVGGNTIRSLERLGYKVDTSVTPYCFWNGQGAVDFTDCPDSLYFPSFEDIRKKGYSNILEVPVTIRPRKYLSKKLTALVEKRHWLKNISLFSRVVYKYLCPVWLEPAFSSAREMARLIDSVVKGEKSGPVVINIMFHSMEIIPGASPMAATHKETQVIMDRLDKVLSYLAANDFKFMGLNELYDKVAHHYHLR